jgi:hypothetical protein
MLENEHIRRDFRCILEQQPDIGAAKIISNWLFEPPMMFDPKPRMRPKPGVVLGLTYIALMAAVCAAFNFS